MPPDSFIERLLRGLKPTKVGVQPIPDDMARELIAQMCAAPPRELVAALAKVEGELIEKVSPYNALEVLAAAVARLGQPQQKLAFAKCAALQGAPKPAGGDQPGAGAAAATVIASDPGLILGLRVEKGGFPQVLLDGIFWNGVWTSRGKYNDPPPTHDPAPLAAFGEAVDRAGSPQLKAACVRAGAAALGRNVSVARKGGAPTKEDPFGLKAAAIETERVKASKRAPIELQLALLDGPDTGAVLDELKADPKGEVARIFKAALELDDEILQERIGQVLAAAQPSGDAEKLGTLGGALERALAEVKGEPKRKAAIFARIANASRGRKVTVSSLALGVGEAGDKVIHGLEKHWMDKVDAAKKSASSSKGGSSQSGDIVSRCACADLFKPPATAQVDAWRAAFAKAFEKSVAAAVLAPTPGA